MLANLQPLTRDDAAALDRKDPLAPLRQRFVLPSGILYFDGNSLGPPLTSTRDRILEAVDRQWGRDLIGSWNRHGWIDLPRRLGARIARLIGAGDDEVLLADSTSVNLFKLLAAAVELTPGRSVILTESSQFPTDLYMAQGLAALSSEIEVRQVAHDQLRQSIRRDVAVVYLSHVDFKTGERYDMAEVTRLAHEHGALVLWDLSHSAGAMEIDLAGCQADLAVGCSYKYLNGGPGAPAYVFVAERHQAAARSPLWGWLGHRDPFAFSDTYRPAPGIDRFQCGTPPILSLVALDAALDVFDEVDLAQVRRKSVALGDLFLDLVAQEYGDFDLSVACPTDAERRGSQVCLRHDDGYPIVQALIERGMVGDFRAPDVLRFGLTPLYLRYADVWDGISILRDVLRDRAWDHPRFERQATVT